MSSFWSAALKTSASLLLNSLVDSYRRAAFRGWNFSATAARVPGTTPDCSRLSRKMKFPMAVMPVAVLLVPRTGTPAFWATGSAAKAVLLSVGPMIADTLSSLIRLVKTLIPSCLSALSSLKTRRIFAEPRKPPPLISPRASSRPFLMDSP